MSIIDIKANVLIDFQFKKQKKFHSTMILF